MKKDLSDSRAYDNAKISGQSNRSEALEKIVSQRPKYVSRWGFPILISIFGLVVFVLWIIRYPETYQIAITFRPSQPSQEISTNGRRNVSKVLVKDGERVVKGQVIALTDSGIDLRQMDSFSKILDSVTLLARSDNFNRFTILLNTEFNGLGQLQKSYDKLKAQFLTTNELNNRQKLNLLAETQMMKRALDNWQFDYELKAEMNGNFVINKPIAPTQMLAIGNKVGTIIPVNSTYYGEFNLPSRLEGVIIAGQRVELRFDELPFQEFGYLVVNIKQISHYSKDKGEMITVDFPDGLNTTKGKNLQFLLNLNANALLTGKNESLFKRVLGNVFK